MLHLNDRVGFGSRFVLAGIACVACAMTAKAAEGDGGCKVVDAPTESDYLGQFSAETTSDNSTLVTAHIAKALAPAYLDNGSTQVRPYNAVGFDLSTSAPVSSASNLDYEKHALLQLRGGIVNLDVSLFAGRNFCESRFRDWAARRLAFDHWYPDWRGNEVSAQLLPYILNGVGLRAVKSALDSKGYVGVGTAYLGIGTDGPLFDAEKDLTHVVPGWMSAEVFAAYNVTNLKSVEPLLGVPSAPHSYFTATAKLTMSLPGSFFIGIEYTKGLGSFASTYLGDITIVRIGYNKAKEPAPAKKNN